MSVKEKNRVRPNAQRDAAIYWVRARGKTYAEIAATYGISIPRVGQIVWREQWRRRGARQEWEMGRLAEAGGADIAACVAHVEEHWRNRRFVYDEFMNGWTGSVEGEYHRLLAQLVRRDGCPPRWHRVKRQRGAA